ncbi:HxlR family transcriptional regulator [Actinomycetospora succinea]|uniref:HxlR family transcriptional regulator n=1 Tax=Actinomycetospora succinea TaxID=663603 RepID=A0A4R6UN66_9PSEU|nr:helix-turn-helix domain-containing protein [Actinomycetospora succinea]TDQ47039.1 HxlR family transcriptional regulator [Actinomycetospora succinea]
MAVSLQVLRAQQPGALTTSCPGRVVLDHVTSKWGVLVLGALADGTLRWGELRREVDGISEKMLASTLRTFEADGLVERRAYPEVPPRVEYLLTPLGEDLAEAIAPLLTWVLAHAEEIVGRRAAQR